MSKRKQEQECIKVNGVWRVASTGSFSRIAPPKRRTFGYVAGFVSVLVFVSVALLLAFAINITTTGMMPMK